MSRTAIPIARTAVANRSLVVPDGGWWLGAGSMKFDQTDDYVTGTLPWTGDGPITALAWTYFRRGVLTYRTALSMGTWAGYQSLLLGINSDGMMGTARSSGGLQAIGNIRVNDAVWHRIGMRHPGGNAPLQFLRDGAQKAVSADSHALDLAGANVWLGRHLGTSYGGGVWMIDVRIYQRYLANAELLNDARGLWISPANLVRHWTLESIVGGKTYERIGGTWDTVTGAVMDATVMPFRPRTVASTRTAA